MPDNRTAMVRVEESVLERLKFACLRKHGSLRGHLGREATDALRRHADRLEAKADE